MNLVDKLIYKTFEGFKRDCNDSMVMDCGHITGECSRCCWNKAREYPQDKINKALELIKKNQHTHEYNYLMQDVFNILDNEQ